MPRMVSHPGQALDHLRYARQGPPIGAEPVCLRPLTQGRIQPIKLPAIQPRLAPRATGSRHRRGTAVTILLVPAADTLAAHAEPACDFRLRVSHLEQPCGTGAPLVHRPEIPPRTGDSRSVHESTCLPHRMQNVTLLCESQLSTSQRAAP